MLFRTAEGVLIELKKYDFKNDKLFYEKLFELCARKNFLEQRKKED